ncbi:MAG: transglutaminase domain-containing protein [Deltaproteobacteria bacterium]|nr:transglutaminase domain-containing protein [Deltaproteobacteria bacterium]
MVIALVVVKSVLKPRLPHLSYPLSRHIRYSFALHNNSNRAVKDAEFRTYAPVKQTATQRCEQLKSSHPYQLLDDELGNQTLHFTFALIPPYATRIVTVEATLLLADQANQLEVNDLAIFLQPEKFLECEAVELRRLAGDLKAVKPLQTAENIFRWIVKNVRYSGYLRDARGARYALLHKEGDCTEFMYLFAALCRANNIPARCVGGYVLRESTILHPADYHNWAEFYADGAWRIADPQKKNFMKNQSRYVAMRNIAAVADGPMAQFSRFRFVGNGLQVKMN